MARKRLRKRRNFAHKLLSGAHTQAAISNPCLPTPNYVTTQLKRSIARTEREVKAKGRGRCKGIVRKNIPRGTTGINTKLNFNFLWYFTQYVPLYTPR